MIGSTIVASVNLVILGIFITFFLGLLVGYYLRKRQEG